MQSAIKFGTSVCNFLNLIPPCHNIIRNSSIGNLLKKANTNRDFILGNLREA